MSEGDEQLILPIGTRVVTRREVRTAAGALVCPSEAMGVIVKAPADNRHSYRVRFPSGAEVALRRADLAVFTRFQEEGLQAGAAGDTDLRRYIIYRCVVGSRAYGLNEDASDTDRRGIYLPPAELHWSLAGVPEQVEEPGTQDTYWELQKFMTLGLKANPNVLECLYTPLVELATPLAQELLDNRQRFLSKLVYQTYNGYVMSQFKKMEQDLRTRGEIRWKHAMHLIRLLLSGVTVLREGYVPVRVEDQEQRERLQAIRRGDVAWEQVNEWRLGLHREFDEAFAETSLPDRPDYGWANEFLIRARRSKINHIMLAVDEQDCRSLNTFRLAWRWTDARYNILPPAVLDDIRPLKADKAETLATFLRPQRQGSEAEGFMPPGYRLVDQIDCSSNDVNTVRNWLAAKIPHLAEHVVVFWQSNEAVLTSADIFCHYWDDFCYPASDDVDILPQNGDWLLVYWHEEVFFFGQRST